MNTSGGIMRKQALILALTLLVALWLLPPAAATSLGHEYVVIAWDEEFDAHYPYLMYIPVGFPLLIHAKDYVDWQMRRVLYWFHGNFGTYVKFSVIGYTRWDSDDSYNLDQMLVEAIAETGFSSGLYFNGVRATGLIALTGQDNDHIGGCTFPAQKALIIKHQAEWADDNDILHELSHIYIQNKPADTPHGDCVMSYEYHYFDFYNEPLMPDYHDYTTLTILQSEKWAYFSYQWCDACKSKMTATMKTMYDPPTGFGGMGGCGPIFFYGGLLEGLNNDYTGRIIFCIGMTTIILVALACLIKCLSRRDKRLPSEHEGT